MNCQGRVIDVLDVAIPASVVYIVVHELHHAFSCNERDEPDASKFNNAHAFDEFEHPGIYFASERWTTFLMENPEFIVWVQKMQRRQDEYDRQQKERDKQMFLMQQRANR